ncbi:EamA family transporter [Leifsonia sp. F6_8S_P_1B]|uniref:EamA family transporter n=1 Tax=Leifsonia williamsii TaxID=3035919 RepID=A0ABT8KAU0_9MICO|nr:EamA family transporter [Leifsonia williamsii]MDN4614307.1 EamA family transporter [Leifsonia williamsii]
MPRLLPPVLAVLGSCVSVQFGAALATPLFAELGSWGVTLLRLALAAVILIAIARPRSWRWRRGQWREVVPFGIAFAGMNGFFYASIAHIPLGPAVAIEFLGPLGLAAILSRRGRDLVWVGLALVGVGLLGFAGAGDALDPLGVVFALVAGAFWALYVLTGARVGRAVDGIGGLAVGMAVSAVVLLPIGLEGALTVVTRPELLLPAAAMAVLASVIPYTLELSALRRLPERVFGVLLALEPAVATLAGWLLLGQTSGWLRLAAIALVIAASIGSTVTAATRTREAAPREPEKAVV